MNFFYLILLSLVSFFFYIKFIPLFEKKLFASPTKRGFHTKDKPTSGGIIFVLVFIFYSLINNSYLPLLSLPMALVGLLDDKFNIKGIQKFFYQIITVSIIIIYAVNSDNNFLHQLVDGKPYIYLLLLFTGTAIINIINFMDGIDGLIAGSSVVIFLSIFSGNLTYIVGLIIPLLIFLYFNWNPSRIFMGDSGSLFIGSYLVTLIYTSSSSLEIFKIILLCLPLLLDSSICILMRLIRRQNIFQPHKLHLYQRLVSNGLSHSNVSLIYISVTLLLSVFYIYSNVKYMVISNISILIFGIYLDKKYAKRFN